MRMCFMLLLFCTVLNVNAQVKLYGTAKNYKDTVFYISETGGFHNFTGAWRDNRVKVTIGKNGHFKASVPEDDISTWCIKTGKGDIQVSDLVKGDKLKEGDSRQHGIKEKRDHPPEEVARLFSFAFLSP